MSATVYKALDVREFQKIGKLRYIPGVVTAGGEVTASITPHVVVIAEDVDTHIRTRFDFFPSYSFEFGGKLHYGGYCGDYNLLVPGDRFWVSEADPKEVHIINQTASE